MTKQYQAGQRVKITKNQSGHMFDIGEVVTVIDGDAYGYRCRSETGHIWWTADKEMQAIEPMRVVPAKTTMNVLKERPAGGKMIYAVVNADGILELEQDRDDARVIKAELGGLKAGVKIVQYAPVKEIR